MNLISCHGFGKDENLTVVLLCRTWFVGYQLEKWFIILEHNSKNLGSLPNEVKQIIHAIYIGGSDYVITCYKQIASVSNTIIISCYWYSRIFYEPYICHGFGKDENLTVVLLCRTWFVGYQ